MQTRMFYEHPSLSVPQIWPKNVQATHLLRNVTCPHVLKKWLQQPLVLYSVDSASQVAQAENSSPRGTSIKSVARCSRGVLTFPVELSDPVKSPGFGPQVLLLIEVMFKFTFNDCGKRGALTKASLRSHWNERGPHFVKPMLSYSAKVCTLHVLGALKCPTCDQRGSEKCTPLEFSDCRNPCRPAALSTVCIEVEKILQYFLYIYIYIS